jgi:hypothetical protein
MRALHHFGICDSKLFLDLQLFSAHARFGSAVVRGVGACQRATLGGQEKLAGTCRHGHTRARAQARCTEELGRQAHSPITLDLEVHHRRHHSSTLPGLQAIHCE